MEETRMWAVTSEDLDQRHVWGIEGLFHSEDNAYLYKQQLEAKGHLDHLEVIEVPVKDEG